MITRHNLIQASGLNSMPRLRVRGMHSEHGLLFRDMSDGPKARLTGLARNQEETGKEVPPRTKCF